METTVSNFDKIFTALERLTGSFLLNLHDEAGGYCFKKYSGEWETVSFDFANGLAGLGNHNRSLL